MEGKGEMTRLAHDGRNKGIKQQVIQDGIQTKTTVYTTIPPADPPPTEDRRSSKRDKGTHVQQSMESGEREARVMDTQLRI